MEIGDWFVGEKFTYIRIYDATKAPILFPKIVIDHMVLTEITYQSYYHGIGVVLNSKKEHLWPDLPITIRAYQVTTTSEAEKCGEAVQLFHLGEE